MRRFLVVFAAAVLCAGTAYAQDDTPSLGEVARQSRLQKQQKDAQSKDGASKSPSTSGEPNDPSKAISDTKAAHVITNEELPEHTFPVEHNSGPARKLPVPEGAVDDAAAQWKSQIESQKQAIASLQQQIKSLSDSIHFASGNCVSNCVQWNERQRQKMDEVETMKSQLDELQKHLDETQEAARREGFGTAVYDP